MICPNHTALSDPFFVAFAFQKKNPLRVMAKIQLMRVPVIGWLLGKAGIFGVDRGHADMHAAKTALRCLKEGHKLLIFPEGTRVEEGENVDAKTGAAMFATRTGVPIVPMYIPAQKQLFRPTTVVIGEPYYPQYARGGGPRRRKIRRSPVRYAAHPRTGGGTSPVKIRIANSAGFCYGVRRAVELAEGAARSGEPCVMLGSIIHNQDMMDHLARHGLRAVVRPEEVPGGERGHHPLPWGEPRCPRGPAGPGRPHPGRHLSQCDPHPSDRGPG